METLWYPSLGLLLHLPPPRPVDRHCLFSGWFPSRGFAGFGVPLLPWGGMCKAPLWGWEEDGRDARGFDFPPCFPLLPPIFPSFFAYPSFLSCPTLPMDFGDRLPPRAPSTVPQILWGVREGEWTDSRCLQGGSEGVPPSPWGDPYPVPCAWGSRSPPFPSLLGSNLGVRAPSLYKPCRGGVGGGSPGMAVAASGREGEVYFVYE